MVAQSIQKKKIVGHRVRDHPLEVPRPRNGFTIIVLKHLHIVSDSSATEVDRMIEKEFFRDSDTASACTILKMRTSLVTPSLRMAVLLPLLQCKLLLATWLREGVPAVSPTHLVEAVSMYCSFIRRIHSQQ
jgi:hypothetical protein